ncbi:DNA-processing protein DprA [Aeromicrobium sp. CTD01-1L150]|uniref:DNA-processing protein DprA n=1 Tax=Aeromicrobium sp. CTD01-1L150 TaxID=3341830 RepID=UPI0035BFB6A7
MSEADDRLRLSLLTEPGDPRLGILLRDVEPGELVAAILRGGSSIPGPWRERTATLDARVDRVKARVEEHGLRWVVPGSREWPCALDDLAHVEAAQDAGGPPVGLWIRGGGRLAALAERSLAVVGARDCTAYGTEVASEIAADAADAGVTVVSGAAFGVDAAAHRGALALGGASIAVLACGADLDYPRANAALLTRIAEEGLVVSEQPPGQTPTKSRFLSRNRLIAALAGGTLVVEAARRSGALNTLRWSDALGRACMAVPGPVTSQQSAGCHRAVRDGKAVLVTEGRDVLAELAGPGALSEPEPGGAATEFDQLPADARRVLDALQWREVLTVRGVADRAGLTTREAGRCLKQLQRRGLAESTVGGWLLARRADIG